VLGQAGALVVGLLVTVYVAGDPRRLMSQRSLRVFCLLAIAPLFVHIIDYWEKHLDSQGAAWLFTAIFALTAGAAVWAFRLSRRPPTAWEPHPPLRTLRVLLALVLALNVCTVLGRPPDDAGYYTNLGAQRWVETGTLPYGDPGLRGVESPGRGAAATYGPLLLAAHVPFQAAVGRKVNAESADPMDRAAYQRPENLATQLTCLTFHLLGLLALRGMGRRFGGPRMGITLPLLYAASPYVFGLGGDVTVIQGLAFVSHIAPTAMVLLALWAINRPLLSGALLATGAGVLFVPAFYFPLWLGWYWWRKASPWKFVLGFGVTGLFITALVWFGTDSLDGGNPASQFLDCTLEHQESADASTYGTSRFGFWGTHPGLAAFWQRPLFGSGSLLKPTFILFAGLCLAGFFLARGRSVQQLAALTAMLAAGVQLWKTHAAGTYVEWYYPFLLIALFTREREPGDDT